MPIDCFQNRYSSESEPISISKELNFLFRQILEEMYEHT